MVLKIFTQPKCAKCPTAKKLGKEIEKLDVKKLKVEFWDTSTVSGLAEASFYSVMATPSVILCNGGGKEVKGWRGIPPKLSEVKNLLK